MLSVNLSSLMENLAPELRLQMGDGRELRVSQGNWQVMNLEEFIEHPLTGDPAPLFTTLNARGEALESEGRFADAARLYHGAARIAEAKGRQIWTAVELNNFGVAMKRAGDLGAAAAAYEEAIGCLHDDRSDLPDATERCLLLSQTLGNLAAVHASAGEKHLAKRFLHWAMEQARSKEDSLSLGVIAQCETLLAQIDNTSRSGIATG